MNYLTSFFVQINDIIKYESPKYISGWNGSFKKIKIGKSNYFRPNKEFSKFKIDINKNNQLNITNVSRGIYVILSDDCKFFYVGKTLGNLKQRLGSHIQKITTTNNNQNTTPYNWQKFSYLRYKKLKEKSVLLDDLKMYFYHESNFLPFAINELENIVFKKYKNLLPTYLFLNDPKNL
jgi:hypothetical protein